MTTFVNASAVADLTSRVAHEVDTGRLPNAQFALAHRGEIVAFEAFGNVAPTTRFVTMSTTKALVAAAVWTCFAPGDAGVLRLDAPVVEWFPEFGTNGKEAVTLEQLLLHTCGFPSAPMGPDDWSDRDRRVARMASWRLNWEPGTRCEYHASSAHWVLAELLERVGDADFRDVVHARVTEPLGIPKLLGIPVDQQQDIADMWAFGAAPTAEEFTAMTGIESLGSVELPGEVEDLNVHRFNDATNRAAGVPGGGAIATAADFARLYQGLLHDDAGIWDPEVLADATSHVRCDLIDPVRACPAHRTIGLLVAGDDGFATRRGFGLEASPRAFGHDGAGGQVAWADPDRDLSFCFLTSGVDRNRLNDGRRSMAFSTRAERCVSR